MTLASIYLGFLEYTRNDISVKWYNILEYSSSCWLKVKSSPPAIILSDYPYPFGYDPLQVL